VQVQQRDAQGTRHDHRGDRADGGRCVGDQMNVRRPQVQVAVIATTAQVRRSAARLSPSNEWVWADSLMPAPYQAMTFLYMRPA
jgi:hypothetical protein